MTKIYKKYLPIKRIPWQVNPYFLFEGSQINEGL